MKKKIALVTGGYSGEATISYQSADNVLNNIDTTKYEVYYIDISKNGWHCVIDNSTKIEVDKNDFSVTVNNQKICFDAVLMVLHGTPGEDGKLQGYFDIIGMPYTTCNAATSALTFNKSYTVSVAAFSGINVAKSIRLFKNEFINLDKVLQQVLLPVFVKPNNGGSSIGISKVTEQNMLQAAIDKAFNEDNEILIEEFIEGREFTIGVFKHDNTIETLPITEIISEKEFFDYEAKYLGKSKEVTPAEVDENMANQIRNAAAKVYSIFNCNGVVRIDFIYNSKTQQPFMLEINTVPGQSKASIIPQQIVANGLSLKEFYSSLIEQCFQ